MADRNDDSSKSPVDSGSADPAGSDKRDREYGMYTDKLVDERSISGREGVQTKLNTIKAEGRWVEIYEFIHQYVPGTPARVGRVVRGSFNAIFPAFFDDGRAAALRVALAGVNAFPDEKVRVEVATMRYIEKMTSIPVPHVYHWGTAAENPLGLGAFMIIDYIPHEGSVASVLGSPAAGEDEQYLDPNIPKDKLERMYKQLANIMLELSKLEMPRIGSLQCRGEDDFFVGSRPLTLDMNELVKRGGIPPSILPPETATYSTSQEWYEALADMHVAHLTFQRNNAVESVDDCRDKFVARHLFRQAVRHGELLSLKKEGKGASQKKEKKDRASCKEKETFRLWLEDLRPHNILVDADLNIVGVIDWEWAYFAPAQFAYDPPYWLLLERPEFWDGTVLEWRDEFSRVLDVFCEALRSLEEEQESKKQPREAPEGEAADSEGEGEEWSITEHILPLSLDPKAAAAQTEEQPPAMPLSERMRESWKSGKFWESYAARRCYGFDPIFWEFVDERFFGKNAAGGYEGRMNLLSAKARRRMELFADRKVEESKEARIEEWDPEAAKSYLREILSDLE
jgi:hypothetical protein